MYKYLFFDLEFAASPQSGKKICEFGYVLVNEKFELIERLNALHEKMKLARAEGRLGYHDYHELQRYFWGMLPLHERRISQRLEYQLFNRHI